MGWHGTVNVTKPFDIISLNCTYMCTHFDAAWLATEVKMSPTVRIVHATECVLNL